MSDRKIATSILNLALAACMLGFTACQPLPENKPSGSSVVFDDCQLSSPELSRRLAAKCTSIDVYEDRQANDGKQIKLHVAKVPAVSRNPAPDPLFILAGGPGQAAGETYIALESAFDLVHQKRDIILVDQRGTGLSNPLRCIDPNDDSASLDPVSDDAEQLASLKTCLKSLPGDPRFYTTPIAMEDLEQVRAALGYEKINLYGVSYGTRAALVYLRQYPGRVRTVILDGVAPPDWLIGPTVARDAQRAMEIIFERCQQQSACNAAFPNLEKSFKDLLARLDETPQAVEVPDPITGETVSLTLDDEMVANALRLLTYVPESASILPLLIHNAAEHGDLEGLAAQYLMVNTSLYRTLSDGMYLSVLCSEDAPFFPEEGSKDSGLYFPDQLQSIVDSCSAWTRGDVPSDYHQPVESDVPVLLLSGEADPITPPANAEQAAKTLPNSLSLVVAGQGHNIIFRGCVPRIARDFIEKGSVQSLDTGCIRTIQPAPFFTSLTGPTP